MDAAGIGSGIKLAIDEGMMMVSDWMKEEEKEVEEEEEVEEEKEKEKEVEEEEEKEVEEEEMMQVKSYSRTTLGSGH